MELEAFSKRCAFHSEANKLMVAWILNQAVIAKTEAKAPYTGSALEKI
jgi:hypothetical protein